MIIDGHAHIGRDKDGTLSDAPFLLRKMGDCKIDRSVIFPLNDINPGPCFLRANNHIADTVSKYPLEFIGFARLDPEDRFALVELDRSINELGLRGIKLHPVAQSFEMSSEKLMKIVRKAEIYDVPIIFHTQGTVGEINFMDAFDEFMASVMKECPTAKIIMGHSGMNFGIDGALQIAKKYPRNIFLEISICNREVVEKIIKSVSVNQVIFGTDMPYGMHLQIVKVLNLLTNEANLSDNERAKILGGNIGRLIARDSYWRCKRNELQIKMMEGKEIGKCAVMDSRNPITDLQKLIDKLHLQSDFIGRIRMESVVYPIDFSGDFFLTKTIYLYIRFDEISIAFLGDGWNEKIYAFTPMLRFSEILSGKSYLPELVHEDSRSILVDAPVDGIPSEGILRDLLAQTGLTFELKSVFFQT
jgi:predicted TIM-barrel fold metal-dependent hydrolase